MQELPEEGSGFEKLSSLRGEGMKGGIEKGKKN